ncbi:MAG TPA: energy transducer TonB [Gemmatimonadales bacterium]
MLIGWAVLPRSAPPPRPSHIVEVIMPPYHRDPLTAPPVLPALPTEGFLLAHEPFSWPALPDIPMEAPADLTKRVHWYGSPGTSTWWQTLQLTHGGTVPGPDPMMATVLDDPPEVLSTPPVHYPPLLREAGIEGSVLLEFVVDTTGRVEPATIRIISSTQALFEAPAREAVTKSVYRPGRWRGEPVRALALERVAFTIQR